ncbi:hypothetical protein [Anabaena azotica]|uniref:Uncharacterized protein n=1 Tax=Anabaena azotica FACHB-119 TaxID=947527 RepID=A0ABR8CX78_9NOST|nr:hypothetical protein [Anabaena azotica]MBD2499539.1 hypothetical protein [Anabaena azotica FACHB-119]
MNHIHPDDLPSNRTILLSKILIRQLEEATKKSFFLACNRIARILLASCHWYFKIHSGVLVLIMICPDMESYQNIMTSIPYFTKNLRRFANTASISVTPPVNLGVPWIIEIDEIGLDNDALNT